jgi:hypothetical protein
MVHFTASTDQIVYMEQSTSWGADSRSAGHLKQCFSAFCTGHFVKKKCSPILEEESYFLYMQCIFTRIYKVIQIWPELIFV